MGDMVMVTTLVYMTMPILLLLTMIITMPPTALPTTMPIPLQPLQLMTTVMKSPILPMILTMLWLLSPHLSQQLSPCILLLLLASLPTPLLFLGMTPVPTMVVPMVTTMATVWTICSMQGTTPTAQWSQMCQPSLPLVMALVVYPLVPAMALVVYPSVAGLVVYPYPSARVPLVDKLQYLKKQGNYSKYLI